jgi:hypothetical protein
VGVRVVVFEDQNHAPEVAVLMEFRLTYEGELLSTQGEARDGQPLKRKLKENKHRLRCAFHTQMRRLWDITPFLKTGAGTGPDVVYLRREGGSPVPEYSRDALAARYALYGFNFVPLVTKELDLLCALDILFLRADRPGDVVWRGDIDNRLKTLIDSLRIPEANEDYSARTATEDEKPMYCLLADDKLVTKITVETDQLLTADDNRKSDVKLVIKVRLRPYEMHIGNMQFGG